MTSNNNWTEEWLKAQQKIVGAWAEMAKDLGPDDTASQSSLWADGLELWQKNYLNNSTADVQQVVSKCMEMGRLP